MNSSSDVSQNSASISASLSASLINSTCNGLGLSAPQTLTPSPDFSFPDAGELSPWHHDDYAPTPGERIHRR